MSEITTMTLDETLQLLQISQENLAELLSACGWGDLTQFTEEQSELLLAVNEGHTVHNWPYLESYLRNVAHRKGLTPEQFDEMAAAITQAGGTLFDYREQFEALCQQVIDGASPQDVVTPQDKVSDSQIKDVADSLTPVMSGEAILDLVRGRGSCQCLSNFAIRLKVLPRSVSRINKSLNKSTLKAIGAKSLRFSKVMNSKSGWK